MGTWMTNVRKRRLYPLLNGQRKPKTQFDYCVLTQKGRNSKNNLNYTDYHHFKSGKYTNDGDSISSSRSLLHPIDISPTDSLLSAEFYADENSSHSTPWEDEDMDIPSQQCNTSQDMPITDNMELASPFNLCNISPYITTTDRTPLELACT